MALLEFSQSRLTLRRVKGHGLSMSLKAATLLAIIGLSISFLMMTLVNLGVVNLPSFEANRIYWVTVQSLLHLPLINFMLSLYLKQK